MSLITRLHHASVIISEMQPARNFYEGVLGLTPSDKRPVLPYGGVWYEIGANQIHLLQVPNPDAGSKRPEHGGVDRHVALVVDDFDQLMERLDKAGVPYSVSKSGRRALFCRDPDGNAVELIGFDI
ncbi:VOC family protein [Methyloterricola oryzae]|uniref:VOC family protein n=1 Tax=Methyloterricola oryzae TaxID=1495050 RepID=UPI0005EBB598|nr:VOC family protein [Methyloterricola oryzae]